MALALLFAFTAIALLAGGYALVLTIIPDSVPRGTTVRTGAAVVAGLALCGMVLAGAQVDTNDRKADKGPHRFERGPGKHNRFQGRPAPRMERFGGGRRGPQMNFDGRQQEPTAPRRSEDKQSRSGGNSSRDQRSERPGFDGRGGAGTDSRMGPGGQRRPGGDSGSAPGQRGGPPMQVAP